MSDDALAALKALLAEKLSLPDYREVEAHLAGVVVLPPDHPLRTQEDVLRDLWNGDIQLSAEQRKWIRQALDAQEQQP